MPPSNTSTPAQYISNWIDIIGIWKATKLAPGVPLGIGPRLAELYYLGGTIAEKSNNQINDYSGFFRDETNHIKYTQIYNFDSEAWFESGLNDAGTLTTKYLNYQGAVQQPSCNITRSYVAVPTQPFIVICYTLTNTTANPVTFNILDQLHLHNGNTTKNVHAWYDAGRNALFADMSQSGQYFVVLGALQPMTGYQVGDESQVNPGALTVPGWYSFDNNGTLQNNNNVQATDVSLAFNQRLDIPAGQTSSIYMYVTIRSDLNSASTAADLARQQNGNQWFTQTATQYTNWLNNGSKGKRVNTGDAGIDTLFIHSLIMIKNLQNPGLGTICATTNPVAYLYKNWVRDASVTAIALDASGHYTEAEQYWRWMASKQLSDGTWFTNYRFWDGIHLDTEPEYDSVGNFLYGVYRHYMFTGDMGFINDLWPVVQRGVNWILNNISSANGLGAKDNSIWEEGPPEYNSYTQAWYIAGIYAAQWIAEIKGDTTLTDWYSDGSASILTALQRPDSLAVPGMWNSAGSFYNRAVNANNTPRRLVDSSSDLLIALGLIDHDSSRASNHIEMVRSQLTHLGFGIARYQNDEFYDTDPNSPASNEAGGPEPSWPQMSMWVAIYEMLSGNMPLALQYLQWHVSTSGKGFMPHGEAVNNNTSQPVLSSMSEPLTASSFILASLLYTNQFDPRIVPPTYNVGAYKALTVNQGAPQSDWGQWSNVPYFIAPHKTRIGSSMTTAKRVYITNDDTNIYVRVDNLSGNFTAFNTSPLFALRIYSADFANGQVDIDSQGLDLTPLNRPMSYMVERHSDQIVYQIWSVIEGIWTPSNNPINSVIAPQWDPNTGRIEAVIPISVFASANPTLGSAGANMIIALATYDQVNNIWNDDSKTLIHYRLTTSSQNWIYGNIE